MITKATKWGNSLAIRIPKQLSDYLCIKDGAGLEFEKYAGNLLIKPVKNKNRKETILIENIKFLSSNKSLNFLKKEPDLYEKY